MSAKGSDGIEREFQHPFVQANAMFIGEFLCLIAFKILFNYYRRRGVSVHHDLFDPFPSHITHNATNEYAKCIIN